MSRYLRYAALMAVGGLLMLAVVSLGQMRALASAQPASIAGGTVVESETLATTPSQADGPANIDRVDATPRTFTYQGALLNAANAPVPNGAYSMRFTLYRDNVTAIWQETQSVSVVDGFFSARLGSVTALSADQFLGATIYIGVAVAGDAEMAPRQPLTQVPFAFVAEVAQRLDQFRSYGVVNADGSRRAGVRFDSSRSGTGIYLIDIKENYVNDGYVTSVTPLSNNTNVGCQSAVSPLVNGSNGRLLVELFGPTGNRVDCSFQFSVLDIP